MYITENKPMMILVVVNIISLMVIFWLLGMILSNERELPGKQTTMELTQSMPAQQTEPSAPTATGKSLGTTKHEVGSDEIDHTVDKSVNFFNTVDVSDQKKNNPIQSTQQVQAVVTGEKPVFNKADQKKLDLSAKTSAEASISSLQSTPVEPADETCTIRVRRGDTLWKISKRIYGTGFKYKRLLKANPHLSDPAQITTGELLRVPL
jgi:nucleoid-associated protein YgaU